MLLTCMSPGFSALAATNVYLRDVPDYEWHAGCFGTATGNLIGYWDRHGFPDFYTGPTAGGIAPLNSFGENFGIRSLWAAQAGLDGRPYDQPGHVDNYYVAYSSTAPDPYLVLGRPEHEPDCLGDFIGLSQNKWKNLDGECDGNIDAYSFVYWDSTGERRVNFTPGPEAGWPAIDIQSGLRAWTEHRGFVADVYTQLSELNPETPPGAGFTFDDLRTEIDAGYPVLFFVQDVRFKSRTLFDMDRANPLIHGVLAYGYYISDEGALFVRHRTSFAGGDTALTRWDPESLWAGIAPLRGVIGYHPRPQITQVAEEDGQIVIEWHGPDSELYDTHAGTATKLHWYVVERAASPIDDDFTEISEPTTARRVAVPDYGPEQAFFRLKIRAPDFPGNQRDTFR